MGPLREVGQDGTEAGVRWRGEAVRGAGGPAPTGLHTRRVWSISSGWHVTVLVTPANDPARVVASAEVSVRPVSGLRRESAFRDMSSAGARGWSGVSFSEGAVSGSHGSG